MPAKTLRHMAMATVVCAPITLLVIGGQVAGAEPLAHASAAIAVVLGLPWVVPAFVAVAVASAPLYVGLHIAGMPQELAPWLSAVILIAAVLACHVNATLLIARLLRKRARAEDGGLADFLFRQRARTA